MNKIAVGPEAAGAIDIDASVEWKTSVGGQCQGHRRERPDRRRRPSAARRPGSGEIRRWRQDPFITDGDVAGAIAAYRRHSTVDMLMGVEFGTPEEHHHH